MKTATQEIKVEETQQNAWDREDNGNTETVVVEAQKLRAMFEADSNETLEWNEGKTANITSLIENGTVFDAYPQVWIDTECNNAFLIQDGRHRINAAANKGLKIAVSCDQATKDILANI